jgi:uncharacterized membrane protein YbhN (UPF0104 family)
MRPVLRRRLALAAQLALVLGVLWFAASRLSGQWNEFRAQAGSLRPDWWIIAASALLVLATYALLIQSWRMLVGAAGSRLRYPDAARIWFVSNLGRYVPGKVWQIGAMGMLSRRAGVSPLAATGSAILGTLLNLGAGFVVLLIAGVPLLRVLFPRVVSVGVAVATVAAIGLLALPALLPLAGRVATRVLRRDVQIPRLPARIVWGAVAANLLAWIGYGIAFRLLALAFFPQSPGNWVAYVAVFTGSYLAGYLALLVPGGLVVREGATIAGLVQLGLASYPQATVLAVASRLWLTALEVAPGLLFLARGALSSPSSTPDVSS